MDECIFCKIIQGEISSEKIWENENFLAILDAYPVVEGHTIVIPKKHSDSIMDVSNKISSEYIFALQETAKVLKAKYNYEGFNIILNNGKIAGQVIGHVHFHIIPRRNDDGKKGIIFT